MRALRRGLVPTIRGCGATDVPHSLLRQRTAPQAPRCVWYARDGTATAACGTWQRGGSSSAGWLVAHTREVLCAGDDSHSTQAFKEAQDAEAKMAAATRRRVVCRKCLDIFHFSVVPPAPFVLLLVMVLMLSSYLSGGFAGCVPAAALWRQQWLQVDGAPSAGGLSLAPHVVWPCLRAGVRWTLWGVLWPLWLLLVIILCAMCISCTAYEYRNAGRLSIWCVDARR